MWFIWIFPILSAITISIIHIIGEKISERMKKYKEQLENFGAGLMVGIIFLELFPIIVVGHTHLDEYIYLIFLVGFSLIAVVEKIIFKIIINKNKGLLETSDINITHHEKSEQSAQSEKMEKKRTNQKKQVLMSCLPFEEQILFEGIAFIVHGLVLGLLIAIIFETYQEIAFIILIPVFLRTLTLSFSSEHFLDELSGKREKAIRISSLLAPIIGAIGGLFLIFNKIAFYMVFALTLGLLLFIVVRDLIPLGKKGRPFYFVGGVILSLGIFLIFRFFVNI
ncbi:MAG: hypothetical protein GF308_06425 [Candidatus Heimdallarchaeota archaeon]|nr:hypothetical protein [Candidatus Heimdallarchaeota archaeon]